MNEKKQKNAKKNTTSKTTKTVENNSIKKNKKKSCLKEFFNNLTLEQITIFGICIICLLLIVLICVSTKNTKTTNGKDIVAKLDGKTITADDLYKTLKDANGMEKVVNLVDEYILNKEYKTTEDMKSAAESTISNYKSTYGDNYQSFLSYNGIKDEAELKEILIKNSKLKMATEDYIKESLTKKEMNDYYENNIHGDIEAKHILIKTDIKDDATDEERAQIEKEAVEKAESIIEKIKKGEKFDDLAKKYSEDEATKDKGGNLGYFNTGEMVKEFEEAAYKLKVNEYTTEPVKTTYGYHIIMKTGQKEKSKFDKAKKTIIEKLVEQKQEEDQNISTKAIINLREKYNLKIKDKAVKKSYKTYLYESTTTTTTTTSAQ